MIGDMLRRLHEGPVADSVIALVLATALICAVVFIAGHDPVRALGVILCGGLGDLEAIYDTCMASLPLIFSGLSLAIAFRAGLFNIGSEGQILAGGFCAAIAGHYLDLGPLTVVMMAAVGALAGFLWSTIPIVIRLKRGAHEVIGCIMMNYIAINVTLWLVRGPFRADASTEKTPPVVDGGWWPALDHVGATSFNAAFLLALVFAVFLAWLLFNHPFGFELRAAGANPGAARSAGIRVNRTLFLAFGLAGAISGLGGATGVSGVYGSFNSQFSPGYGFDGITVALLGRNHPLGVVLAAMLFGMMRNSSRLLQWEADISPDVVILFQGFVILALIAAPSIRRAFGALALRRG